MLTGKYRTSQEGRLKDFAGRLVHTEQDPTLLDEIICVAEELNSMPVQVAMAWLRYQSAQLQTSLIQIIGSRTIE